MQYAAERRQFALGTGEIGAGKSTMARLLTSRLNPNKYMVLYITDSDLTSCNFYYEVLYQLGHIPRFYRGDAKRQLNRVLALLRLLRRRHPHQPVAGGCMEGEFPPTRRTQSMMG